MGFDPSLLPVRLELTAEALKREENWIAIGLRSLFENVGECDRVLNL
jgi:hypothetical protein